MEKIGGKVDVIVGGLYGSKKVTARVDTGAKYVSIDYSLAAKIGAGPVVDVVKVSSPSASRLRKERRPVVPINLMISDEVINCNATLSDRRNMKYDIIIGREVLKKLNLMVDVTEYTKIDSSAEYVKGIKFIKIYSKLRSMVDDDKLITPAILSLEYGGNWSIKTDNGVSISVMKRKVLDDVVVDIVYLLVNPKVINKEGKLLKLDKCGEESIRAVGEYPRKVTVKSDVNIKVNIDPKERVIFVDKLDNILELTGTISANFYHELIHVTKGGIDYEYYITDFEVI